MMEIIQQYVFEVGDLFTGLGEGGYLEQAGAKILIGECRFLYVKAIEINGVYVCGDGDSTWTTQERLTYHIKRGNLVYLGNTLKGKTNV